MSSMRFLLPSVSFVPATLSRLEPFSRLESFSRLETSCVRQ
jgi:hypothetical protein